LEEHRVIVGAVDEGKAALKDFVNLSVKSAEKDKNKLAELR
jgi:hypothetical protein